MSGGSSRQSSEPKDVTPQVFKNLQGPFADVLTGLIGDRDFGLFEGGPLSAPESPGETEVRGLLAGDQPASRGRRVLRNQALRNANRSDEPLTALGLGGHNEHLQSTIDAATRPIQQNLAEQLETSLPGRFTQAGQFAQAQGSSAFDRAAAIATRGATQEIGDIASEIAFSAFESFQDRKQGALDRRAEERADIRSSEDRGRELKVDAASQLPAATTAEIDDTIKRLQAQALPRMIQDLGIERGLEVFQDQVASLLTLLSITAETTRPAIANESQGSSRQFSIK